LELVVSKNKPLYMVGNSLAGQETFLLFDDQEDAIRRIGDFLKNGVPTDQISMHEITIVSNGLSTQELEWSQILNKLVQLVGLK
jgi:hypothetical protein